MNRQELIESNKKLVYHSISKYYPTFINDEDIIQSGMVGLCLAANSWDESRSKFSTYAAKCILNSIKMELRNRNKHYGVLSLEYETDTDDGKTTFGDLIEGDSDIDYVDVTNVRKQLNARQLKVFDLLVEGMSKSDIARKLGMSRQHVNDVMRKIKLVWRNTNGN
jgi:RNA polymerase sporulation-specific sigma factor